MELTFYFILGLPYPDYKVLKSSGASFPFVCSACTAQPAQPLTETVDTSSAPVPVPVAQHRPMGLPLPLTQIIIHQSEDGQMHVEHRAPTVSNRHIIHTIISPIDPSQSIVGSQLRQMVSLQLPSPLLHVDAPHSTPVSACCFKLIIINKFNIIFIFYFIQVDFQVNFNSFGVSVNRTDTAVSLRTESSPNGQFDQV